MSYREPSDTNRFVGAATLIGAQFCAAYTIDRVFGLTNRFRYGVVLACIPSAAIIWLVSRCYVPLYNENYHGLMPYRHFDDHRLH